MTVSYITQFNFKYRNFSSHISSTFDTGIFFAIFLYCPVAGWTGWVVEKIEVIKKTCKQQRKAMIKALIADPRVTVHDALDSAIPMSES